MEILPKKENNKTFIFVTQDMSGLGFAKMTVDAGHKAILAYKIKEDEECEDEFLSCGDGIAPKVELEKIFSQRAKYKDAYWIFDQNHNSDKGEVLRKEGFKVFGGSKLTDEMEHDRHFGTEIVKKAGLATPPTFEFSDIQKGLDFLDQNEETAYVFKPDDGGAGTFTTYVPDSVRPKLANRELYAYMCSQDGEAGTYILQERKDGVEVNLELWLYKGKPILGYGNFECKRKLNHDEGEMCGCAQDVGFIIPVDCKGIKLTVENLLPQYRDFTGFLDMNVIVCDREMYFLEFCARFGYNAHPNVFLNLALKPFPEIMSDWIDGKVENFKDNFRFGFGSTITLYIDHPKAGYPLYLLEEVMDKFYHFDTMKEEEDEENEFSMSGYGNEIGIVGAHAYNIEDSAKQCLKNVDKITYPNHACRSDLDLTNYETSPQKRFEALNAMKFFDKYEK